MRRLLALLGAAVTLSLLLTACRQYLPTNRYLQPRATVVSMSTADARHKFDHAGHAPVMRTENIVCGDCHRFDALIEADGEDLAAEVSTRALYPGSAACHYCHTEETKHPDAPGACITCHDNLAPLKPESHDLAWAKVHGTMAQASPGECANCHKQAECINCHQRRDTIQTIVHDRNFRFYHGVVARANPMQCGSCHREDYCIRCHQQGKVKVKQ